VNRLTDKDDIERTTGMAHDSGVPVTLRPVREELGARARAARRRSRTEREA
jgi:hypothetical protein